MAEDKISIPRFNGKEEAFETWWIKFYYYAQGQDFAEAVSELPEAALPTAHDTPLDENNPAEKKAIEARACNKMACTALMLAMPDELILQADLASKGDTNWPKGKACLIMKYLMEKFRQAGAMTTFKAQTQINAVTMGKGTTQ